MTFRSHAPLSSKQFLIDFVLCITAINGYQEPFIYTYVETSCPRRTVEIDPCSALTVYIQPFSWEGSLSCHI